MKMFKRKQPDFEYTEQLAKFNLGDKVEDKITGYQGVVENVNYYLFNSIAYGVKGSKLTSDNKVVGQTLEETELSLVESKFINTEHPIKPFKLNLGDEVKSKIENIPGIVVTQCNWLNGCNNYGVKVFSVKNNKTIYWLEENNLELVQPNKTKPIKITASNAERKKTGNFTGGLVEPSERTR